MDVTFCAYDGLNYVGGPNAWLRRLLPALRDRGIHPRVLFFLTADPEHCTTLQALRAQGIECRHQRWPIYTEQCVTWLLKQLASDPPDVFVPNLMVSAYYAAAWARAAGIPTVGILHSDDAFHHGLLQEFVLGAPAYRLSALVCVSRFLEQMALAQHPPATQVWRLPYGAPTPEKTAQRTPGQLKLAYVGRLVEEQKRVSEVTRAFCRVARAIPGVSAAIYGEGPARPAVEQILRTEGAGLPVRLAGKVDSDQIQQQLAACHALALLSDYEGLPISLMEAMACGVVPVCLRTRSGVAELVEHGVTGLLVDDRADDFLAAIRRLAEEPGLWERLSRAARAKIDAEYSAHIATADWEELLRTLQSAAPARQAVQIPSRLELPAVHPDLAREDRRRPPAHTRLLQQGRRLIRRVRQQLRRA
jgi:glycosyltransferase involved in cell wall biosynthesis